MKKKKKKKIKKNKKKKKKKIECRLLQLAWHFKGKSWYIVFSFYGSRNVREIYLDANNITDGIGLQTISLHIHSLCLLTKFLRSIDLLVLKSKGHFLTRRAQYL